VFRGLHAHTVPQPSDGDFAYKVDYSSAVVRQVVKALYTSNFEPLDQPCLGSERGDEQSVHQNKSESERQNKNYRPDQMMLCAQAIRLLLDLRLKSDDLVQQTWDILETISRQHLRHDDFPKVVTYTFTCIYEPTSPGAPLFSTLYKLRQDFHKALKVEVPDCEIVDVFLGVLCNILAIKLVQAELELIEVKKKEMDALESIMVAELAESKKKVEVLESTLAAELAEAKNEVKALKSIIAEASAKTTS
jgi:hypothetical protein